MTSALLLVALLAVVDLSYRRWMRRSVARRRGAPRADREIVLGTPDAAAAQMRTRRQEERGNRRG